MSGPRANIRCAVLLAAGRGERLFPETKDKPKPLVTVGGTTLLHRMLGNLQDVGIERVLIIAGYRADMLRAEIDRSDTPLRIDIVDNPRYRDTNNIYSLWLARQAFDEDFLLVESDLLLTAAELRGLTQFPQGSNAALLSPKTHQMSGTCATLDADGHRIRALRTRPDRSDPSPTYKTVNVYRLSAGFAAGWLTAALDAAVRADDLGKYYETLFETAIDERAAVFDAVVIPPDVWFEVDTIHDLDIAEYRCLAPAMRQTAITGLHGGYWRYGIVDHSLIHNYHYPPASYFSELAQSLVHLVREYPAAQIPIAAYLAAFFEVSPNHLVAANGVSEIIRSLRTVVDGPVVVPVPAFNEFDSLAPEASIVHVPLLAERGFELDPVSLVRAAVDRNAALVVITTPNNPTGTATRKDVIVQILTLLRDTPTRVLVDESFIDFQEGGRDNSLISECANYPNLAVVSSLSKTHGIAGIRLGVLISDDDDFVAQVRTKLPIWNINGFAEHYARHCCALRQQYFAACRTVRRETASLAARLSQVPGLQLFPSQANFLFCRIDPAISNAALLRNALLEKHNILIKECGQKLLPDSEQYIRISSRTEVDNDRLVDVITAELANRG